MQKKAQGVHLGKGVEIFNETLEKELLAKTENGKTCGSSPSLNLVLQKYIPNPMTVFGHKFDFRIYALIASTNPLVVYYHDGFLRVSLNEFDIESQDSSVHLTNTEISKKVFDDKKTQERMGMDQEELRNFQMWNLTRFQDYLLAEKLIDSKEWLESKLRTWFKEAIVHLALMSYDRTLKKSGFYEILGIDFVMDTDFKIWVVEVNGGPAMVGTNQEKHKLMMKMLTDMHRVSFALLRSRIKRVLGFFEKINSEVEEIHQKGPETPRKELAINFIKKNQKELNREFRLINSEYFDEEYPEPEDLSWVKIADFTRNNSRPFFFEGFPEECTKTN